MHTLILAHFPAFGRSAIRCTAVAGVQLGLPLKLLHALLCLKDLQEKQKCPFTYLAARLILLPRLILLTSDLSCCYCCIPLSAWICKASGAKAWGSGYI